MNPFLPDFTRWIWLSEDARVVWEMRINAIARAWAQVEAASVVAGVRDSIMLFPEPAALPQTFREAAVRGLLLVPLNIEGGGGAAYSSGASEYVPGQAGKYRAVITRPELAGQWLQAYADSDEMAIGKLLGYPPCCSEFYRRVWVQEKQVDTTWDMAQNGGTAGPPESNILLRWLTVRLVPHLPCSFNCEKTVAFARSMYHLWEAGSFLQELQWAQEMLSWPMEYSALHGVAEIRTPILTIMSRTDWSPTERLLKRDDHVYPKEGAQGLRFPYRIVKDKATGLPAFARAQVPIHTLNGFGSAQTMEQAHATVLKVLGNGSGKLLDLGCGSGRLLEWAQSRGWQVTGVEVDPVRAGAAQVPVVRGSLYDVERWAGAWDTVLFMPGRLIEVEGREADVVRQALLSRAGTIVMYAYGDWLSKYGSLDALIAAAGFEGGEVVAAATGDGVAAARLRFPAHIGALEL